MAGILDNTLDAGQVARLQDRQPNIPLRSRRGSVMVNFGPLGPECVSQL